MRIQLTLLLATTLTLSLHAQVLPPDAVVGGKTQAEWSAEWWKWAFSTPTNQHPLFDTNGSNAHVGQPDGPVFLLAGIFSISGVAQRSFSVLEGKYLFFPVVNVAWDNVDVDPPLSVEAMRDAARAFIDTWSELHASIDGVPVANLSAQRVVSPVFNLFYHDGNNLISWLVGHPVVGPHDPIVSDGYWLMIEPLPPGTHRINFGGTLGPPINFILDITDTITVVPAPVSLEQKVEELLDKVEAAELSPKRKSVLEVTLLRARDAFATGKPQAGIRHLRVFQHQVRAQLGRAYPDLAQELISGAQAIVERGGQEPKHDRHEDEG